MRFSAQLASVGVSVVACVIICGCGSGSKDPNKVGSQFNQLFASADAETKACWDTAMAAAKTNGYAVTIQAVRTMIASGKLTPEQAQAAQDTATATSDKMYDAANKGDAAAKQAIDELRKASGR